ncbi:MAG TPA: PilT/PilU family type 4a pilus ATPase [Planctomycetota bacterium]|nr:PilT/PilU family type 4a pilus ATPase [Planctomycetota bacterium]
MDAQVAGKPAPVRILYADPDPASIAASRSALEKEGWTLQIVADGDRCLAHFERGAPDVCIIDVGLPDIAGLDLLPRIHGIDANVPVIIIASEMTIELSVAAMGLGAANVLCKPLDTPKLLEAVRKALQLGWGKREVERLKIETGHGLSKVRIDEVLADLVLADASDLHLKVGRRPLYRVGGDLVESRFPVLDEDDLRGMLLQVLGPDGFKALERDLEFDSAYVLPEIARCRVNAYKRMGQYAAAFRMIPLVIPTIELMGLPPVLKDICRVPQGLVLLTGPTGSGKSTSLAAMIDYVNDNESLHIITIEDPIEFVYTDKKCSIDQRQLGSDTRSLHEGLRRVLRQDPDIILVGEMRDRESMELAMHAAETGHLVFSTLHTNDAKQTIDRIVDTFPVDSAHQIRSMLALTLHAVVSQRLIKRADGQGRVAAVEVMINSPNIRELIAEGKTSQIEKSIAGSGDFYQMQTFNQSLAKLTLNGTIGTDEALACSTNPNDLKLMLKGIGGVNSTKPPPEPPKPIRRSF